MAVSLVTGGAGFLGSHLAEALVARGGVVRVLDNFSSGTAANLAQVSSRIDLVRADLADPDALRRAIHDVDVVFHLAAPADGVGGYPDPAAGRWACAADTLDVLIAARQAGVRRVVYASSQAVYGGPRTPRVQESDPLVPLTPHGYAKLVGECHCLAFTSLYGLETVRLRYSDIFGPRQPPAGAHARAISIIVEAMCAGRSPALTEDVLAPWDFLYVGDAVHAALLAAEAPRVAGKAYNIARGWPATLIQVAAAVNAILGTDIRPLCADPRPYEGVSWSADVSRAEAELGFCPVLDLKRGLQELIAHHRQDGELGRGNGVPDCGPRPPHFLGDLSPPPPAPAAESNRPETLG